MAGHKFKVGDSVDFAPTRHSMAASRQPYTVVRLMPPEGGEYRYRVKCLSEPYERIAREFELSRLSEAEHASRS